MILRVLADYYDTLAEKDMITPIGWSNARVSFGLRLDAEGNLTDIYSLKAIPEGGKKELPIVIRVPEQIKKTSGVASNFLCENSSYLLGLGKEGKDEKKSKERALQCFEAAKKLHYEILEPYREDEDVNALLNYFDKWDPGKATHHEVLARYLEEIVKDANLIFMAPDGTPLHKKKVVIEAWENYQRRLSSSDKTIGRCLVTGNLSPIARLHPSIKGVAGAQSSGASLVSFNASAFESYGHELADDTGQGYNSPVSEMTAFKYTTALNYLLADKEHTKRLSDMTLIYWAENADTASQALIDEALFGDGDTISTEKLDEIAVKLKNGEAVSYERSLLKGDTRFYILGLAPNAARLAVSYYQENSFGNILDNLVLHYRDLEIVRPSFALDQKNSIWHLLYEVSNKKSKDKKIPNPTISAMLYAVLNGTRYPDSLFENLILRIQSEHDLNWRKAALIKACLIRAQRNQLNNNKMIEEVLRVDLNKESDYIPYVLGREFAVLERIQQAANPDIKATIKDRYFTSASATPAPIFAMLLKLSQHHIRKLSAVPEKGRRSRAWAEGMITELENRIREPIPARLNLQDQGIFYLGYYHQKQEFFAKNSKEETSNE